MKIGVDFDNTLVSYDRAFATVGKDVGLLPADFTGGKGAAKRRLCGEESSTPAWERLQGLVYGRYIDRAELYAGAAEFLQQCRRHGWQIYIVSHKTILANYDPQTNLHDSARGWMTRRGFFDQRRLGLGATQVFFEETREAKVRRIGELNCDIFIDDLPEVFRHADMPSGCRKILFCTEHSELGTERSGPFECAANWTEVSAAVFKRS
jgi:hypothetical protein